MVAKDFRIIFNAMAPTVVIVIAIVTEALAKSVVLYCYRLIILIVWTLGWLCCPKEAPVNCTRAGTATTIATTTSSSSSAAKSPVPAPVLPPMPRPPPPATPAADAAAAAAELKNPRHRPPHVWRFQELQALAALLGVNVDALYAEACPKPVLAVFGTSG